MDAIKKVLGLILGAGMGWIGTAIRVALAGVSGYLISKGVDAGVVQSTMDLWIAAITGTLAALGSWLNSDVQLKKPAP